MVHHRALCLSALVASDRIRAWVTWPPDDGRFELAGLAPGVVKVVGERHGYVTQKWDEPAAGPVVELEPSAARSVQLGRSGLAWPVRRRAGRCRRVLRPIRVRRPAAGSLRAHQLGRRDSDRVGPPIAADRRTACPRRACRPGAQSTGDARPGCTPSLLAQHDQRIRRRRASRRRQAGHQADDEDHQRDAGVHRRIGPGAPVRSGSDWRSVSRRARRCAWC